MGITGPLSNRPSLKLATYLIYKCKEHADHSDYSRLLLFVHM